MAIIATTLVFRVEKYSKDDKGVIKWRSHINNVLMQDSKSARVLKEQVPNQRRVCCNIVTKRKSPCRNALT